MAALQHRREITGTIIDKLSKKIGDVTSEDVFEDVINPMEIKGTNYSYTINFPEWCKRGPSKSTWLVSAPTTRETGSKYPSQGLMSVDVKLFAGDKELTTQTIQVNPREIENVDDIIKIAGDYIKSNLPPHFEVQGEKEMKEIEEEKETKEMKEMEEGLASLHPPKMKGRKYLTPEETQELKQTIHREKKIGQHKKKIKELMEPSTSYDPFGEEGEPIEEFYSQKETGRLQKRKEKKKAKKLKIESAVSEQRLKAMIPPEKFAEFNMAIDKALEDTGEVKVFDESGKTIMTAHTRPHALLKLQKLVDEDYDKGSRRVYQVGTRFAVVGIDQTQAGLPMLYGQVLSLLSNLNMKKESDKKIAYKVKDMVSRGVRSSDIVALAKEMLEKKLPSESMSKPGNAKLKSRNFTQKDIDKYVNYMSKYS